MDPKFQCGLYLCFLLLYPQTSQESLSQLSKRAVRDTRRVIADPPSLALWVKVPGAFLPSPLYISVVRPDLLVTPNPARSHPLFPKFIPNLLGTDEVKSDGVIARESRRT